MKLIWRLFTRDLRQATRNVIAVVVTMGLVIVPALYAWYNIAASWDPYGNTKALKVAVANTDSGYKSDLIPVPINVGETVISALRANHDLDWQFVDRDKAVDGVYSGEYYAALVIPKSFSADMMTLFSPKIKHAQLEYYLNEKINPIAPHITDEGASTVANTIDRTFVKTLSSVALNLASNVADYAQSPEMAQYAANATTHVKDTSSKLNSMASQIDSYSNLLGAANSIIDSTDKLLGSTDSAASDARKAMKQAKSSSASLSAAVSGAMEGISSALGQADSAYASMSTQIDDAFTNIDTQASQVAHTLTDMQGTVQGQADSFGQYADALQSLADSSSSTAVNQALTNASQQARQTQQQLQSASANLGTAANDISNGTASVAQTRQKLKDSIAAARKSIRDASDTYTNTLQPQLDKLTDAMDDVASQTDTVIAGLSRTVGSVSKLSSGLSSSISDIRTSLGDASAALRRSAKKLDTLVSRLSGLGNASSASSAGRTGLSDVLSSDPDALATMLSAPVSVNRIPLYPTANYGSAMTPFYTILSIWVGAIILVAMLKVSVSDHEKAKILGLGNDLPLGTEVGIKEALIAGREAGPGAALDVLSKPRMESPGNARAFGLHLHHEYFGRYMIFGFLALLQGTLVCLGDLLYLGVQCEHPVQFMMVGWLAALVFSNMVYTLTVSFGDIGKAIAVVLLVVQVAGTGGTFPIETLPPFFQVVSKWLLFPYAVDAMHSAMAGAYGMEYWIAMGKLALFLVPSLLLGLLLRKPVIRFNDWIIRNLESTKVM
ncbi:YhgE/Pip domain-containing protein [Bifidobacterium reuteri]|uniref:YhgE/Pip domain-containing protein n=1 Tax=Bifidobacterium reuteri TaxID=983706 RepID=A0A5J5E767_9BIFI|nr:YhgE/Pip domain-containing protein [Bifidobacterium reuteri]KAA8825068.1 YhgE/Pip domain-containing protein [Bifidobacterium reuteri]